MTPETYPFLLNRTCLIVEDEPLAQDYMYEYATQRGGLRVIGQAGTVDEASRLYALHTPDIIFLDIEMPGGSGIDWLAGIAPVASTQNDPLTARADGPSESLFPFVILTTAYHEYALRGYELLIADYLLKPITEQRFDHMLQGINRRLSVLISAADKPAQPPTNAVIWLKTGRSRYQATICDIAYLEGYGDFTYLVNQTRVGREKILISERLGEIQPQLPIWQFKRISRSVIVNRMAIKTMSNREIRLHSGECISVGATYRNELTDWLD